MQISAAFFTAPSKRAGLQEYYENMKADAINAMPPSKRPFIIEGAKSLH